ncbi:NlpC/P60 family protein [Palleronia marisminoris]|uniref:Gamma-D-glutamyl-L-lysine endopeptidase n=1 Tax=Palleronia marisminoris TaxID=315423 RepID=A0A1Y5SQX6_9RHOB|nr:NlpC/P60 family protein [Palleronia marisminoris]SFG87811.1 NlpC/P60 family protein [Palleronia marisminoris]SLN43223.1 Gamma-D-glutamyl-L-lysine endopeptidase [Palleronia marisminoris]
MTDRRLTPANGRVAARELMGRVEADRFVAPEPASITVPVADLWSTPERTARDRQLLLGEEVDIYERRAGMAFLRARKDGYVGYLSEADLGEPVTVTHVVGVPATHLYSAPDMKRPAVARLSFGARLRVVAGSDRFFETDAGLHVPRPHLTPANRPFTDPASVAQLFFGVPYLWGGNSSDGIDCSGVVQAACLACHLPCPGDSDLQEAVLGQPLGDEPPARGDLYFWKGHVAMAVDGDVLIHANAHHMAVTYEPIEAAIARIEGQGDGPVTSRRRL